jgi:DNA polymerase-3 subunit beta
MTATATKPRKARDNGISLSRSALSTALNCVAAAVPGKTSKPILLNVLLANGGLTATDLELMISVEVPYVGDPLLLPYARLAAILKETKEDTVTIHPQGSSAVITIKNSKWTIPTENPDEFPRWDPQGLKTMCHVPADQFVRAARAVTYAIDEESNRYALGSVLVETRDGVATFVATDGRRLASYKMSFSQATDDFVRQPKDGQKKAPLVPANAIKEIQKAAEESKGEVLLEANASELVATIDGTVITSRLIDGRFPKWEDVFPKRDIKPTVINADELASATRQAAIVTSEQSKGVTFAFSSSGISLSARSSEAGESQVECPILDFGQAATVKLDPRFVGQLLKSIDKGEPVSVEAAGKGDAVVFWAGEDKELMSAIMPLADE